MQRKMPKKNKPSMKFEKLVALDNVNASLTKYRKMTEIIFPNFH
jgi:ABC-type branched-subunit amino acid transport system ATPase component